MKIKWGLGHSLSGKETKVLVKQYGYKIANNNIGKDIQ
jgi:hypothetical protein